MSVKQERRDFIGLAFGAVAAVGGAATLVAVKKTGIRFLALRRGIYDRRSAPDERGRDAPNRVA